MFWMMGILYGWSEYIDLLLYDLFTQGFPTIYDG